jgi:hypothetical protein
MSQSLAENQFQVAQNLLRVDLMPKWGAQTDRGFQLRILTQDASKMFRAFVKS